MGQVLVFDQWITLTKLAIRYAQVALIEEDGFDGLWASENVRRANATTYGLCPSHSR